jgi:hypothetical protein
VTGGSLEESKEALAIAETDGCNIVTHIFLNLTNSLPIDFGFSPE